MKCRSSQILVCNRRVIALIIPFSSISVAIGQTTRSVDRSTPKQSIATMFAAVAAADAETLKQGFLTESPQSADLASAYADLIVAARRLREATRAKFSVDVPNPAAVRDGTTPGTPPPEQAAQLAASEVEVAGDTATVRIPDRPVPVRLHKVDGAWLIDLAEFAAANPQQLAEQAEVDHALATAMQETADEINAGKYASAQEVESAVQQKIHAVIAPQLKSIPTTMPTSTPTTLPR